MHAQISVDHKFHNTVAKASTTPGVYICLISLIVSKGARASASRLRHPGS